MIAGRGLAAAAGLWLAMTVAPLAATGETTAPPTRAEVESQMGIPSDGDRIRGQRDAIGFVTDAGQADAVILRALEHEGMTGGEPGLVGAICPHDDHLYAADVYVHVTEEIRAPVVVLIGVFHRARAWNLENRLVFDAFESWRGPWGPVPVHALRQDLLARLPAGDVVVDNAMHDMEHSLEAIVPFLAQGRPDRSIVPILAPYMDWEQLSGLASDLSTALADAIRARGWLLGRDVAIVISSDAVHYGPDFDHAPFGEDAHAYERAVEREHDLIERYLAGPIEPDRLRGFLYTLVDESDVHSYRIPWCGRFSIPFGLELLRRTATALGMPAPEGRLLRYGTSLSEPEPALPAGMRERGLGYTAPSNFHHWVGYAAIGYRVPRAESGAADP